MNRTAIVAIAAIATLTGCSPTPAPKQVVITSNAIVGSTTYVPGGTYSEYPEKALREATGKHPSATSTTINPTVNSALLQCESDANSIPHLDLGEYSLVCVERIDRTFKSDGTTLGVAGYTDNETQQIVLDARLPIRHMRRVVAHESAHAWLAQHLSGRYAVNHELHPKAAPNPDISTSKDYSRTPGEVFAAAYARCTVGEPEEYIKDELLTCEQVNRILDAPKTKYANRCE